MKTIRTLVVIMAALVLAGVPCLAQYAPSGQSNLSRGFGRFVADNYDYPVTSNYVLNGNSATGTASITVQGSSIKLPDGRVIYPFNIYTPIIVGNGSNQELVTPTSVSNCYSLSSPGYGTCTITASFSNTHGQGDPVQSGTSGVAEASYDAFLAGGGVVVIDQMTATGLFTGCTGCYASFNAMMAALDVFPTVAFEDDRTGVPQFWVASPSTTTILAAPSTLTATTVGFGLNGANTTGGAYTGASTYHVCIAYVDIGGQEGPCSADFSGLTAGTGSTNQIGIAAPAASTGAVGYTVYISLAGGTYNLTYQAPLTSTTCTLTKVELITPACAVTNTNYGQTGSNAVISSLTVNTAPLHLLATTASTTSAYIGTPNGRTTYAYSPRASLGIPGLSSSFPAFTIGSATGTTVPNVIGTINLPIGLMNVYGRTLRICGEATEASAGSTATIENIELLWDAAGSNTTGAGVIISNLTSKVTLVTSNADFISFCGDIQTTTTGAGVTAGAITPVGGYITAGSGAGGTQATGSGQDQVAAATGSLNLAGSGGNTQRILVVYNHTTGTDAAGMTLLGLTVSAL